MSVLVLYTDMVTDKDVNSDSPAADPHSHTVYGFHTVTLETQTERPDPDT